MLGQSNTNIIASYIKIENEDITVTQNGVYEASAEYTGLGTVTVQVDNVKNQQKTVNPTKELQTVEADEGYTGLSRVTINPVTNSVDNNIQAGNIKSGVTILGITGNLIEVNNTQVTVTPSTLQQTITPSGDYNGFSTVNVNAVDSSIDPNIVPSNIISGKEILGVEGSAIELNGAILNVTPTATSQTFIPTAPNNGYIQVNVNGDNNLVSDNIVKDVTIFGVTGTHEDGSINNQDKTIIPSTIQQVVTADSGYTGLGTVTVDPILLKDKAITQNGVYNISSENHSYTGLKVFQEIQGLIGNCYWYKGEDVFDIQVGDSFYNGQIVNGEVIPNFNDPIDTVAWIDDSHMIQFSFSEVYGFSRINNSDLIEIEGHIYFKVYFENDQYVWVDADSLSNIVIGTNVYASTDDTNTSPDTTTVFGTVTYISSNRTIQCTSYTSYLDYPTGNNYVVYNEHYDGYREITVDVPSGSVINNQDKTVTQNGIITADEGYTGLGTVTVNVPSESVNNQDKVIDFDGVYTADSGYTGLGTVTVNAAAVVKEDIEALLYIINSGNPDDEGGEESYII